MTKIATVIVYTDTHIGAPHATHQNASDITNDFNQKDEDTLVLATGDIFDITHTKRKNVGERIRERDELKILLGKYYIYGNHECSKDPNEKYFYSENGIIWLHYHVPAWCDQRFEDPCDNVTKWENKRPGLSKFQYWAYRFKHKVINRGAKWKPSSNTIESIVNFSKKHDCNTVIFGHTHKNYDQIHDGVRIINAGRGKKIYKLA